jgi:hypothetical protein
VSTHGAWVRQSEEASLSLLGIGGPIVGSQHFVDRGGEIVYSRARDDNRIPAPVRFFGNAKESATVVLPKFDVKTLPLDLQFFGFDYAVHIQNGAV